MRRLFVVAALSLSHYTGWSQTAPSICSAFTPPATDIAAVFENIPNAPSDAKLDSACFITSPTQVARQIVSTPAQYYYGVYWPTELLRGVQFSRVVSCSRTKDSAPKCANPEGRAHWQGSLVSFDDALSPGELVDFLNGAASLMPPAFTGYSVNRTYISESGQRFAGLRRYQVTGEIAAADMFRYTIERRCFSSSDCAWTLTQQDRLLR
jgi:hypothetical protein